MHTNSAIFQSGTIFVSRSSLNRKLDARRLADAWGHNLQKNFPVQDALSDNLIMMLQKDINSKRNDYLNWQEYFMATAFLAAKRSKDPCSQVGACIVNDNNVIVGVGYNGMPIGCHDDEFPWSKESANSLDNKYLYVCHAELNAILNKNSADVKNCTIYVGLFPCNECAKVIIQSGIKEVIYMSDKHNKKIHTIASKRMLDSAGITYKQFIPKHQKIVIDFSEINWNMMSQLPSTPIKKGNLDETVNNQ